MNDRNENSDSNSGDEDEEIVYVDLIEDIRQWMTNDYKRKSSQDESEDNKRQAIRRDDYSSQSEEEKDMLDMKPDW